VASTSTDIRTHRLAHHTHALDLALGTCLVAQAQLDGPIAVRHMLTGRFRQLVEGQTVPETIAGIGGQTIAVAAEEPIQWLA
jgi:hypothetical protein